MEGIRLARPTVQPTGDGVALREVRRWGHRYAVLGTTVVTCVAAVLAPFAAPAGHRMLTVGICAAVVGWGICYVVGLGRVSVVALLSADTAVVAGVGLTARYTVTEHSLVSGTSWVVPIVSISMVAGQWLTGRVAGVMTAVLLVGSYLAGCALVAPGRFAEVLPLALFLFVEGALSRALFALVRRGAREADRIGERDAAAREAVAIAAARRADDRQALAALHDTAAATLLMVGMGTVDAPSPWLAEQAARDLTVLRGAPAAGRAQPDLAAALTEVVRRSALPAWLTAEPVAEVSAAEVAAVTGSVSEALRNVALHSGAASATVSLGSTDTTGVSVQVRDDGCGFGPEAPPPARRGIRDSIVSRMGAVGGRVTVRSAPGLGTTVSLELPGARAAAPVSADPPTLDAASRLLAWLRRGALCVSVGVLLGSGLPTLLADLPDYRDPVLAVAAYGVYVVAVGIAAVRIVRGRDLAAYRWPLLGAAYAASVAAAAVLPNPMLGTGAEWSYSVTAFFAVALLVDRPLRDLLAALAGYTALVFGQLLLTAGWDGRALVGATMIMTVAVGVGIQIGAAAGQLRRVAARAERDARTQEIARTNDAVGARLHADRQGRYRELATTAGPLLDGLATGRLDPGERGVRRACAVEAARLRRLLAESDDVVDPLAHELRACADVAERRGIAVDLAVSGRPGRLPKPVRRALTDPILPVLAGVLSWARITVTAVGDDVAVSVVGDAAADLVLPSDSSRGPVRVDCLRAGTWVWVEACQRSGS